MVTRGMFWAMEGATWPNEGLPRGTHLQAVGLIFGLLKLYGGRGVRPPDLPTIQSFNKVQ
jgi:hypothetical protein